ncbi:MAG: hypothetical protein HFF25_07360 [Oscillospiraceae bacterium]|nr:hypothetical protein [Oscillospiraceae bacterium]
MKRKLSALLAAVLAAGLFVSAAYASSGYQSGDVPIGSSNEVLMVGTVVPSVMSVTMPTYVPFGQPDAHHPGPDHLAPGQHPG